MKERRGWYVRERRDRDENRGRKIDAKKRKEIEKKRGREND